MKDKFAFGFLAYFGIYDLCYHNVENKFILTAASK